jgi:hypothetical protein
MDELLHWIGGPSSGFAPPNIIPQSSITIITPLPHPALHHRHSAFPGGTPVFPREIIILPFNVHFDSLRANLSIPIHQLSQMDQNDIGMQFRRCARPESHGHTKNTSNFFAPLIHFVFLHLSALMGWLIQWM